jgi:hypothetical protein
MDTQETMVYAYNLDAGGAPLQLFVLYVVLLPSPHHDLHDMASVEPAVDQSNHYTFSISMKAGHVERALCSPVTLRLSIDPRQLDFSVL